MKRTDKGNPYLSWCLIARNCEDTVEATLKSLRERTPQAEIVVVDTMSNDKTPEICKKYADVWAEYRGPRGDWDREMPWFDDAAAARQRSFELASGRWRGWIDADDVLPGAKEAERLLKLNSRWKPDLGQSETRGEEDKEVQLEDLIKQVEDQYPSADCIYAPYLYERDGNDHALLWQERERIVKWSKNWKWMERSHEVLCPIDGTFGQRIDFAHLLFVHEKKFNAETTRYALERHFDVIHKEYKEGEQTTRRCLYLAAYAPMLCPDREAEFISAAYKSAGSRLDRYRSKLAEAQYYFNRGLYMNTVEALGSATNLRPDLPDAWIMGGECAYHAEDYLKAKQWLEKGLSLNVTHESYLNPRKMAIHYPVLLAGVLAKMAHIQTYSGSGDFDTVEDLYKQGTYLLHRALTDPSIGADREQIAGISRKMDNLRNANRHAINIAGLSAYLVNNDEPLKAVELLKIIPHTLEDHPITVELERWSEKLKRHIEDPESYADFYQRSEEVGIQIPSPTHLIYNTSKTSRQWVDRAYWAAELIAERCPNGRVLDVGCFDGLSAIPMLQQCPDVRYVGVDLNEKASQRLRDRFEELGMSDRTEVHVSPDPLPTKTIKELGKFDIITWFEVIEHVSDVQAYLKLLKSALNPGGLLLISTPWGSFDDGLPPSDNRDSRGHVRAMTAKNFVDEVEKAGLVPDDLHRSVMTIQNSQDTLHCSLEVKKHSRKPVTFAVCSALWDWNSRSLHRDGMGASEETICYLGKELAKTRRTEVYGPVPDEEVHHGVRYWPHEKLRHVHPESKVVVSRAPHWGTTIDEKIGFESRKILWLQDAEYPDLNKDVAAYYEDIVVVSNWHKQTMHENHGVPLEQMTVAYNFILPEHFMIDDPPKREPHHFIYASSPDRGLIRLLNMWPMILEKYPDATLDVFYGWRGCNKLGGSNISSEKWTAQLVKVRNNYEAVRYQKGVTERGMIPHREIAREFMRASVWAYPTHFSETCLHPDSEISVPGDHSNGSPVRVKIKDLAGKSNFPVYAFDEKENRFVIKTALWCEKTKVADKLLEIELDDGKKLKVTPDHKIMNFDGEWVEAQTLAAGDRLKALHHRYDVMIKDADGKWKSESRLVGEWMAGRSLKKSDHSDKRSKNRELRSRVDEQPRNHKIVNIRTMPGCDVYDMEVEDCHNFVAEGVVVHNCCTNAFKARAAGCVPLTSALAALNETAACDQSILIDPSLDDYGQQFLNKIEQAVETSDADRKLMSEEAIEQAKLTSVLPVWEKLLS